MNSGYSRLRQYIPRFTRTETVQ
ncbi:MAG: hypothetical protein ACE5FH_06230 [Candidatus Zixiibacteriota bacterium]